MVAAPVDGLLDVSRWPDPERGRLLMLQCAVPEETAPYLVSSSRAFLLVEQARNDTVRCGVRELPKEGVSGVWLDIVEHCVKQGQKYQWGQSFPNTAEGTKAAIRYVRYYNEDEPLALIHGPGYLYDDPREGVTPIEAAWLPAHMAVVVPEDRLLVGNLLLVGDGYWAACLHNVSRTVAVCR